MKHIWRVILILVLMFLTSNTFGLKIFFSPDSHVGFYLGSDTYTEDPWPDSSFTGTYEVGIKEAGYPYHSGIVKGINDTIEVWVSFRNQTGSHIDIIGTQPEDWIIPAIFDVFADLRSAPYIDTSDFDYSFKFWWRSAWPSTLPDTIYDEGLRSYPKYGLVYHIWNLPLGWSRLRFFETSSAPSNFEMLLAGIGTIWYTEPVSLADTICAFAKIGDRAIDYVDYNAALAWADSILLRVPTSVVGWNLKAHAYNNLGNNTLALQAADSVITIGEEYRDGILPDSAGMDDYQRGFLNKLIKRSRMIK